MASKDQASVIRRSSRGRTGIDAKTKTDSGCFVDDDVEKQIDKSPPRNKSESNSKSEFFNANSLERNKKNTSNNLISGNSYNAVAHQREMSHSDELLNDEEAQGDSKGNINTDAKPNGDFYCLYYSDSPNSSLTRNKEKSANSSISDNGEDIGAKAEELLQKVKSEALRNKSTDDSSNKVNELPAKRKPPPVAPKPKRNSKNDSTSPKDPILDELEKLGASVGRDFSDVQKNDSSVFSNAVKELQVAKTPEECFNRFDAIQSSLLENVPDTLERKKAKDEKEQTRRRSFPGADRNRKLSDGSNKDVNGNKSKENKKQESPKPLKQKSEVKKFSRTERESLQSMKEDSHHKRSHMNTDTSYTPKSLFSRPDSYRITKTESTKKIVDKKESNKENIKKDKKPSQPTKGAKIGKKVDTASKGNGSTKTKDRLKLRSSRRRINGDLTSIPEDGVIGVRIDDLDDNAIPLAKGEDDLSSGEDDLDKYDEDNSEDITDPSLEELDFPPPPSPSEMAVDSTCCSVETTVSKTTTHESRVNVIHENDISGSRNNSQRFENTKLSHEQLTSQQRFARAQSSSLSSDGWTSESTAGYSSANDADDEIERLPELETSEDFETYEDPEEIADMTFGTVIDGAGDDDTYIEEAPHRIPRSDIIVERRQQLQRKHVAIDREASSPTYSTYSHLPQESLQDDAHVNHYPIQSEEYQMDVDVPYHYQPEYYGNEIEVIHHGKSNIIDSNIPRNNHITADTISFNNPGLEREDLEDYQVEQRPRKAQQENHPDPSGFMTVEDIKRLIFQGQKPSIPRSSSFCGASSHLKEKALQEQDEFQRQSWSGYSARQQQQQPVIDPLVREFPRRNAPLEVSKNSPYVRTVVQNPKRQHDFFSDSNLTTASEGMRNRVGRSQSFCGGTSLQHRTNSLENYQINVVRGDRGKRSRSFLDAPLQRRANSLDDRHLDIMSDSDGRVGPSRSIRGPPIQRRANSLDEYYSTNKMSSSSQRSGQPIQRGRLFRSPSDSSSDYSHSDNEQYHGQFSRTSTGSRGVRNSPATQYIDTKELFKLLSPQSMNEVVEQQIPPVNNLQHSSRNGRSTFPRKSSESLRIQAIRRASQANSDSDSDNYVETFKSLQNHPPVKQHKPEVKKVENRPTLSQRFSDVPQRINFDELAEQLNLPSDDEEDDVVDGRLGGSRSESEFGADLEFDYGDYFDDNNMIVGEALRLKKVLGCNTKQDPELETLVSEVTDPNIQKCKSSHVYVKQSTQTDEHLPLERPPSYSEVRKEMKAKRAIDNPNHFNLYDTDSSYLSESDNSEYNQHARPMFHSYIQANTNRQRTDSGTQTVVIKPPTEKAISTDELLKMLINSSQGNLQKSKPTQNVQQNPQSVVQNLLFPAPQTKAASTGNIHSEKKFPGHVHQLYGSTDVSGEHSTLNRRRGHQPPPKYHKSHESLRRGKPSTASSDVLRAKLVSSSENIKDNQRRVFEEEVDCMRTKGMGDFSSGEISSGSSLDDVVETKTSPVASVAYIGCEETTAIETLPRVRQSSHRKRRKEVVGFLSDQDIPTVVRNDSNKYDKLVREVPMKTSNDLKLSKNMEPKNIDSENSEKIFLTKKDIPRIDLDQSNSATPIHDQENTCVVNGDQIVHFPHDEVPSPNSVNVFIDYKKNVMKVTTSTPKIQHGKLITDSPTSLSPVAGSPTERKKLSPRSSVGQEEFPPRYDSGSSSERSSSVYSSDDEKFFGSSDTVVFVDKTTESQSNKPNVDVAPPNDQSACANNGHNDSITDDINAYSARVDSLLREVRSSLDLDSIGSDLLDQAMERVKDRLSPRSPDQAFGGLTMEAYVALNQADELQSIINEIKGELQILQEENSMLKETVVSLQLGDSQSTSETTEASFTESAERIESIRKQIAAVVVNKQGEEKEEEDLITIDVLLRGFGETVGLKTHRKTDVKLGQVTVKGGADWTGVYDAAKTTFLDHIKRIAPSSCLGLGPTSMYGAQIGATMLTPETLRKKNPRVEISRKFNSCVIQLKDGMTDSFDTLIYDTLLPKRVIENYVHQILEHRFVVLCGSLGMGKTHLATKLAEHIAQRFGSKSQNSVLTLSVGEKSRKELKKTLANLMKCDISTHSDGVPVVVILDQLDCLASLGDIFDPKQLEGNRNSPFIIGVRNKSKKGPFSAKELAIHKYFRWVQMSVYDRHVLGLLERFLRRKLSWSDNIEEEEDLMDLFIWLTQVWQRINQILLSYVDVEVTIGPSMFYTCPMDINTAEGWFVNVWNYTIIPYLHQNIRNSRKIYERDVPWEDPTKWVIMRWPWSRERSKVLPTLKKLRQVDIVLNRNNMESTKESKKESRSRLRKLRTNVLQSSPSKAGSLESWSTADWETASIGSEEESIASSTL